MAKEIFGCMLRPVMNRCRLRPVSSEVTQNNSLDLSWVCRSELGTLHHSRDAGHEATSDGSLALFRWHWKPGYPCQLVVAVPDSVGKPLRTHSSIPPFTLRTWR